MIDQWAPELNSNLQVFKSIALCFLFWNIINIVALYIKIPDHKTTRIEWLDCRNRIVSLIHGSL